MSENLEKDMQLIILCDMCMEDKTPARKTCMKCEISMCVQHLQAHLTTPVLLQTHPLTEPMALCGTTKCPQHGKLLEYYCLDDMTCVCVSCAIEDQHRLHNMKTFSTAHKELMEKLMAEQKALEKKTDNEHVSLEKWEKREREKLGGCSVRLIEAVTHLRDVTLNSVQSSVSARMVAIKTSKSSMQAAQREEDTFRFLQMYSQVHQDVERAKAVDLRKGLAPGSERDKLVQEIREQSEKMMEQAAEFWGSLLSMVDPDQELYATRSDLVFEPQIFGPGMSLSEDRREVFYSSWLGQCAATLLIKSNQSVPNFQKWLIRPSKNLDWTIGICDKKSVNNIMDGPVYGLCCKENQLSYLTTEIDDDLDTSVSSKGSGLKIIGMTHTEKQHKVSSTPIKSKGSKTDEAESRPETVEVFWNFVASSLSFFKRSGHHQREEILTIKMSVNNRDMVPFVQLGMQDAQFSNQPKSQWKCSCGKMWDSRRHNSAMMMSPYQTNCSCGKVISRRCITEMICELL